ncbi:MAG: T9SS type A sorting domain-containing protein, partial [Bacteroidales bacterium]|nr:T9SS type A sorting domain-containing protein [Bacteroidales bacterium]
PTNGNTIIYYCIPQSGKVKLTLTDVNGKVVYKTNVKAMAGTNSFEINTQNLSSGIYFYKVEYQGEHIVKKLTVER